MIARAALARRLLLTAAFASRRSLLIRRALLVNRGLISLARSFSLIVALIRSVWSLAQAAGLIARAALA